MLIKSKNETHNSAAEQQNSVLPVTSSKFALLRRIEVQERTKLCRSAIYAKLDPKDTAHDPAFPVPVRIGTSSVRWIESEVDAYIAALPRTRNGEGGVK